MTEKLKPATEPPKEPGWYWFKSTAEGDWEAIKVLRDMPGRKKLILRNPFTFDWQSLADFRKDWKPGGKWSGPIPEPE